MFKGTVHLNFQSDPPPLLMIPPFINDSPLPLLMIPPPLLMSCRPDSQLYTLAEQQSGRDYCLLSYKC